jgi:hypothetical protein
LPQTRRIVHKKHKEFLATKGHKKHKLILNGGAINYFVLFVSYPAGLWQGMQSFDTGTFPFNSGRAAIAF